MGTGRSRWLCLAALVSGVGFLSVLVVAGLEDPADIMPLRPGMLTATACGKGVSYPFVFDTWTP